MSLVEAWWRRDGLDGEAFPPDPVLLWAPCGKSHVWVITLEGQLFAPKWHEVTVHEQRRPKPNHGQPE